MSHPSKSNNNIESLPKVQCFGCGVCVNTCPVDCIAMTPDDEGFLYPHVDEPDCIECRKCILTCPGFADHDAVKNHPAPTFHGGNINYDEVRFLSSSGGFFSLAADHILSQNGSVYGAVYDFHNMRVVHARATTKGDLAPMRKSKYVQSDSTGIFPAVKRDLLDGIPVLFTGTPCLVDGLKLFLGETYENLITCDIICHGVPSPGLFNSHFTTLQQQSGEAITHIDFRTKDKGWGGFQNFFIKIEFETKEKLSYALMDANYALFLANLSLRPCCYACPYAQTKRQSDITLGDFWGVQQETPELFDGKGTSLILTNTAKGENLLRAISGGATLKSEIRLKSLPPNLVEPTQRPAYRDKFFKHINFDNWQAQKAKYHIIALFLIVKNKILGALRRVIRAFR